MDSPAFVKMVLAVTAVIPFFNLDHMVANWSMESFLSLFSSPSLQDLSLGYIYSDPYETAPQLFEALKKTVATEKVAPLKALRLRYIPIGDLNKIMPLIGSLPGLQELLVHHFDGDERVFDYFSSLPSDSTLFANLTSLSLRNVHQAPRSFVDFFTALRLRPLVYLQLALGYADEGQALSDMFAGLALMSSPVILTLNMTTAPEIEML
jgi:hypothetical protein